MLHPDIKKPHSVFQYTYTQILRNPTVCSNIPSPRYKETPQGVPIFLTKPETCFSSSTVYIVFKTRNCRETYNENISLGKLDIYCISCSYFERL